MDLDGHVTSIRAHDVFKIDESAVLFPTHCRTGTATGWTSSEFDAFAEASNRIVHRAQLAKLCDATVRVSGRLLLVANSLAKINEYLDDDLHDISDDQIAAYMLASGCPVVCGDTTTTTGEETYPRNKATQANACASTFCNLYTNH